jgi:hypothetical protein
MTDFALMDYQNNLINKYVKHVKHCLYNAEHGISKICSEIYNMEGMTGKKTRHFYNNLLAIDDARYLEIGTWKGSSVCSAMYGNCAEVVCIDNWIYFEGPKDEFMNNFQKFMGENIGTFIEEDCFAVDVGALTKFNIYMYDGDHKYDDQYKALTYYSDCLDDVFIYVVDDWNHDPVREGTRDAIRDLKLEILFDREIRLTDNGGHTPQPLATDTWWNGMYVAVLKKNI